MAIEFRNRQALVDAKGFILDSDGTLQDKGVPIEGACDLINVLNESGRRFVVATNSSVIRACDHAEKLRAIGLKVRDDQVITSCDAAVAHLLTFGKRIKVLVLGSDVLSEGIADRDMVLVDREQEWTPEGWKEGSAPDMVVVGRMEAINMKRDVDPAVNAIVRNGAGFVATNDDRYTVDRNGIMHAGAGALVRGIAHATDFEPLVVGKPHPTMICLALERMGIKDTEAVIVGDNPETDMRSAQVWMDDFRAKLNACLIGTGVESGDKNAQHIDAVCDSVKDLAAFLQAHPL